MSQLGYSININEVSGGSLLNYTPTFTVTGGTANITNILARYTINGSLVYVYVFFILTTTAGAPDVSFSLPATAGSLLSSGASPVSVIMGQSGVPVAPCFANIVQSGFNQQTSKLFDSTGAVLTGSHTYQLGGWYQK